MADKRRHAKAMAITGRETGDDDDHGSLTADGRRGGFGRWTTIADIHLATGGKIGLSVAFISNSVRLLA